MLNLFFKISVRISLMFILIFSISLMSSTVAYSQKKLNSNELDSTKTYIIKLIDGSEFIGNFLSKDSASIVIRTKSILKIEIPKEKIKSIDVVDASNFKKGVYWFPNPNATRYLFASSAFTLKKGEGYYQNTWLFLNSVNIGLTNNISIGGGIEFLSTFASLGSGNFQPIFFVTSKIGFKVTEKFHLGGGIMAVSIPDFGSGSRNSAGLIYGIGLMEMLIII